MGHDWRHHEGLICFVALYVESLLLDLIQAVVLIRTSLIKLYMTRLLCAHADPGSWGIPADSVAEFANSFIYSRAQIANAIGKPFILEETGMDVRLPSSPFLQGVLNTELGDRHECGLSLIQDP